jgi:SAM-dependent methyltransferase
VAGVEPEELMVRHATARTRRFIAGGRLQLVMGRSSDLSSFPDDGFDKACAVDVVYFWSQPERDLREILRVLRPGGRLVLGYAPRTDRARSQEADIARPTAQVEDWLGRAGFNEITSVECHDDARGAVMSWTQAAKPSRSPRTRTTK